jgi:hypothetical protein
VFATGESATIAFAGLWAELQMRLQEEGEANVGHRDRWAHMLQTIEALIAQLESAERPASVASCREAAVDRGNNNWPRERRDLADSQLPASECEDGDISFVHRFDTERRDLERCGHVLELRERKGSLFMVAARSNSDDVPDMTGRAHAQIDGSCALQILSGEMSPLAALEQRLGRPGPRAVENIRAIVGGRKLRRIETRVVEATMDFTLLERLDEDAGRIGRSGPVPA